MRTRFVNLTSSGMVISGEGILEGFYVNSTSSGLVHIYHSATESTDETSVNPIAGVLTPSAGYHCLSGLHATAGIYVGIPQGTIDITFFVRESDE